MKVVPEWTREIDSEVAADLLVSGAIVAAETLKVGELVERLFEHELNRTLDGLAEKTSKWTSSLFDCSIDVRIRKGLRSLGLDRRRDAVGVRVVDYRMEIKVEYRSI